MIAHSLPFEPITLVQLLRWRAEQTPNDIAYVFLLDGETEECQISYAELDAKAKGVAATLQDLGGRGERALLLYPPGLDYVVAFFGCLYAGTIAVPAYPPRLGRPNPRLAAIAGDARPALVLTPESIRTHRSAVTAQNPELATLRWVAPDADVPASADGAWRDPGAGWDTLAFLQYTSGSTADPKGVMVGHGNLIANIAAAHEAFHYAPDTVGVVWLPPYHDMGLIGGILHPLYGGFRMILMSPISFLQRPARWLEAMSRYRATATGGPSSAYQLCVDRISAEERAGLDLSSWVFAGNGAEPVRADVLERFAEAFAPCGFRREAFQPSYGLAEATLLVSGGRADDEPAVWDVDGAALEEGRAVDATPGDAEPYRLVGSGHAGPGIGVAIVDPESGRRRAPGEVGEIWVSGPGVAQGYWRREEETARTFRAHVSDTGEGPFLRTGDLGVVQHGSVYVTGRRSDLIIVRGRNLYPQDIEATVERCHPALDANRGAAFSLEVDGEERVVMVHELPRQTEGLDFDAIVGAIQQAVAEDHEIQPHAVVLIRSHTIPRTSSGKIQRRPCRKQFLDRTLEVVHEWRSGGRAGTPAAAPLEPAPMPAARPAGRAELAIQRWLQTEIATRLRLDIDAVDVTQPFSFYGLDSIQAVTVAGDLGSWLGQSVSPTIAWDYPTIHAVARFLAQAGDEQAAARPAPRRAADPAEPIAIVGMACRFPGGADGPERFWHLLREGRDGIREVPADRWDVDALYDPNPDAPGKTYARHGGFIGDPAGFDADFFGVSPREATYMDPQQRLLLEVTWEALERAAIAPDRLAGTSAGTFVGISTSDYTLLQVAGEVGMDVYAATGNAHSVAANRLSYVLGLEGPSMAVDTACSSSLVAVHLACAGLRSGECDLALAGGVNLLLAPEPTINFSRARMLSPTGRCRAFDDCADGYVRGEGCGVVVLKRLSDAEASGDRILAVIRGSAVNQDGRSNGLTAPHGPSQEEVIRRALAAARVEPAEVDYVEAHGTGTPLGDPIELRALGRALGPGRERPLLVGSVKTNIGHLEAAAGIAGLIKAALAAGHGEVPPHLNLAELNCRVAWNELPLRIATEPTALPDGRRIAGVSSFGFGGTNAHVVLEAPPEAAAASSVEPARPVLVKVAARGERALRESATRLRDHVVADPDVSLAAVAATTGIGRADLPDRAAIVAGTRDELLAGLDAVAANAEAPGVWLGRAPVGGAPKVAFLVPGQGTGHGGALAELYEHHRAVRQTIDALADALGSTSELPLSALLEPGNAADRALARTEVAQPALYALALALAAWWESAGVRPAVVAGHSVGAYAAAALAGVFSPVDGARLVAARGRLMAELGRPGAMAAVMADAATVAAALERHPELSLACRNAPAETVVAGPSEPLERLCSELADDGVRTRMLDVSRAFHSALVEPCLEALDQEVQAVELGVPRLAFVSDTTGALAGADVATPGYWTRHARQPVDFAGVVATLATLECHQLIELGAGATLLGLVRRNPATEAATLLPTLDARHSGGQPLRALAQAWTLGTPVDWRGVAGDARPRLDLPTYPFKHERYWIPERPRSTAIARPAPPGLTPSPVPVALQHSIFEATLGVAAVPFLADHRVYGRTVVPGAAYLELVAAAAEQAGVAHPGVRAVELLVPLVLAGDGERRVQVVVDPPSDGERRVQVYSCTDDDGAGAWQLHAQAVVDVVDAAPSAPAERDDEQYPEEVPVESYYRAVSEHGLDFGPSFRAIAQLRRNGDRAAARLTVPPGAAAAGRERRLNPVLVDAGFQTLGSLLADRAGAEDVFVPVGIDRFVTNGGDRQATRCRAVLQDAAPDEDVARGDILLLDEHEHVVAAMTGVRLRRVTRPALARFAPGADEGGWLYEIEWRDREREPGAAGATPEAGTWLVVADRGGGSALARSLEAAGARARAVHPAGIRETLADGQAVRGVVQLASGDEAIDACGLRGALGLVQALAAAAHADPPRLYLVTRGAQPAGGAVDAPGQAPIWGLGRVVAQEHPALCCTRIDLDPVAPPDDMAALVDELLGGDVETEVAFRAGRRLVSRLVRSDLQAPDVAGPAHTRAAVSLEIAQKGVLEDLVLRPAEDASPGPGQVRIAVRAAGLNFRDVLNALGLYPGDAGPLGGECAGRVIAVGPGVTGVAPGDDVVAIAPASFGTYALTDARLTAPKPVGLSFEQAATIPIAFLTAWYGLERLGRIRRGERVLIHAASGGVGLAALQICRRAGAEVLATAGSERKRAYLESLEVDHISDSRSLAFADEVMAATGGRGVDLVLNSLAGDFIARSMSLLASGGRFIEIGKADIWDEEHLATLEQPIAYHAFDLAQLCATDPELVQAGLRDICAEIAEGHLEPLPARVFDLPDASLAFRHMAQAQHIGKVVLAVSEPAPDARSAGDLDGGATYLVTGGLGDLGLRVARWMVDNGARNLVLAGRSAADGDGAAFLGEGLPAEVKVLTRRCDVSVEGDVAALLADIGESLPSLRGIVHAAGVLDDGVVTHQTWERFDAVMAPKAAGAWNLHRLTREHELDFFVLFSSAAAVLGSPGQASYAAANAFLDALAHQRRAEGLPATALDWGPWDELGMAVRTNGAGKRRLARGIEAIGAEQGLELLGRALASAPPQLLVLPVDWQALAAAIPGGAAPALLEDFVTGGAPGVAHADGDHGPGRDELVAELLAVEPDRRLEALVDRTAQHVTRVLGLDAAAAVDTQRPLAELGLDSLTGVELSNMVGRMVGMDLPATLLFDYPTLEALAGYILEALIPADATAEPEPEPDSERVRALSGIEQLSDEEAEALVNRSVAALMKRDEEPA